MLTTRCHPQLCPKLAETLTHRMASIFDQGNTLSVGATQVVKACVVDDKDLIIKRYSAKGPIAALRYLIGASRADNAFRTASHLQKYNLKVPNHLLVIKQISFFKSHAYLVMEKAEGTPLFEFIQPDSTLSLEPEAIDHVAKLITTMHWLGIAHGDLHTRNFIIAGDHSVSLIDLDGTTFSKAKREKDIIRFTKAVQKGARFSAELLESLEKASQLPPKISS